MKVSNNTDLPPGQRRLHHRMLGLFTRKPRKTSQQHVVDEDTEVENSSSEKDGISIGATLRNEKIEKARSIANAAYQERQRQQTTAADPTCIMQNALAERLEAKLLATEKECTDLRKLAEEGKRALPVSLSLLNLEDILIQNKLELLLVSKENECTKVRKLLAEASKRGMSRSQHAHGVPTSISTTQSKTPTPRPILKRQPSSKSSKQVTWGALSALGIVSSQECIAI
jgi:hypothetical protein